MPRRSPGPSVLDRAPRALGLRMPAEWEPHQRTWIAWPHNVTDWPGKFAPIPWVFGEVVRTLARAERVGIVVGDAAMQRRAERLLARVGAPRDRVDFIRQPTDRVWTRDTGPSFLVRTAGQARTRRAAVCWAFNAWAKYDNWTRDVKVGPRIAEAAGVPVYLPRRPDGSRFVLEGGAIDVDGEGTLLCTEECLLGDVSPAGDSAASQVRNPGVPRAAQEHVLSEALGIDRVVWLGRGIVGDDTHGHIDDFARFVAPARVAVCVEPDRADPNHAILADARDRLLHARDARGRRLAIVELPMPRPLFLDGRRLPASYANFLVANRLVLVPTFNDPNDRIALGILAKAFRGREVVGIHAVDLVWGLGTLHCMTQQEPA